MASQKHRNVFWDKACFSHFDKKSEPHFVTQSLSLRFSFDLIYFPPKKWEVLLKGLAALIVTVTKFGIKIIHEKEAKVLLQQQQPILTERRGSLCPVGPMIL